MILRLSIRPSEAGRLVLGYSPAGRLVYLGIVVLLSAGMFVIADYSVILIAILVITAISALYEERWIFDVGAGTIVRCIGLWIAVQRRQFPCSGLSRVLLRVVSSPLSSEQRIMGAEPVIPEALRKGRAVLLLEFDSGREGSGDRLKRIVVQDGSHRNRDELEAMGAAIALYCGVPLVS